MLAHLQISTLRLMTNNPRKIKALEQLGLKVTERVPLIVTPNPFNDRYLTTKAAKLGHLF
jgi:GTP cyclohydrolase II